MCNIAGLALVFNIDIVRHGSLKFHVIRLWNITFTKYMDIRPFTTRGRATIRQSLEYVALQKHAHVGLEHLLLVFTAPDSEIAVSKHQELVGPCARIREIVNNQIETGDGDGSRNVPQTPAVKQVIVNSMRIAESLGHMGVNPEHLFLALLELDSEPLVKQIVGIATIDVIEMRQHLTAASEFDKYTLPVPSKLDG